MKTIIALAKLYRGILIFTTTDGCVIFNALGQRIPFATLADAESYVDGYSLAETYSLN